MYAMTKITDQTVKHSNITVINMTVELSLSTSAVTNNTSTIKKFKYSRVTRKVENHTQ